MSQIFTDLLDEKLVLTLRAGGVGVLPTDTVYGLVACANSENAIRKMYSLKRRELPPGTLISASVDDLENLGFRHDDLRRIEQYWPNSLSVVLNATNVANYLKQQRKSLAVRIPANETLCELLHRTGPLMTTSANAPKQPTSTSVAQAKDYFGNLVDFYVDAGDIGERPPSTIVGFNKENKLILLREGAVPFSVINA